jgi:hypothetical protein
MTLLNPRIPKILSPHSKCPEAPDIEINVTPIGSNELPKDDR